MNPQFFQSPLFLNIVAAGTVALIGLAFIIRRRSSRKKNLKKEPTLWMAGDYYTFLRANIQTCITFEELEQLKNAVDGFYGKEFRAPISRADRSRYYERLMETVCKRENEMEGSLLAEITAN